MWHNPSCRALVVSPLGGWVFSNMDVVIVHERKGCIHSSRGPRFALGRRSGISNEWLSGSDRLDRS